MSPATYTWKLRSLLNFRDIGGIDLADGYVMKKGHVFRSANPDRIHPADAGILESLGIKTIIDLRSPAEAGEKRIKINGTERINLPLDFQLKTRELLKPVIRDKNAKPAIAEISNQLYLEILDAAVPLFREMMEQLADPGRTPVLIHCQAGKDRTGIFSALILKALGAANDDIVKDFMRSNPELRASFKRHFLFRAILTFGFYPYDNLLFAVTVKQRNIESVLGRVDKHYGGITGYLAAGGADPSLLSRVREQLTIKDLAP
jgi:protein-tyrosine phosphatase